MLTESQIKIIGQYNDDIGVMATEIEELKEEIERYINLIEDLKEKVIICESSIHSKTKYYATDIVVAHN